MIKKFTELCGVSGYEKKVRDAIIKEIEKYVSSYEVDAMGNLIAYKNAKSINGNTKTVILAAHMDEVGLIVTGITKEGMLKFDTVGGIESFVLVSKKVKIGDINGVIGMKPVHHSSKEERDKKPDIDDLYIDIGAKDKADAEKYVMPGDYCSFVSEYVEFGNNLVKAKALDDRIGCLNIIEALKEDYDCNLICLFTVQEETGLRGAKAAVYGKKADYALVLECTTAGDVSKVKPHMKVTEIGGGAAVSIMDSASIADRELFNMIKNSAEKHNIRYQLKRAATGGNDAGIIHLLNSGIKTCTISVPSRYIHSPSSIISLDDFESAKMLVKMFLKDLT